MRSPTELVDNYVQTLTKISMTDFFKKIHSECFPTYEISFMDFFLEIIDNDNKFCIEHTKLIEYGVLTSNESSVVRRKLERHDMIEGEDYLVDTRVDQINNYSKQKNIYYLTPDCFKMCLINTQKHPSQTVDPKVYMKYFLLLEKVYKYYCQYERLYNEKLHAIKDAKIDKLQDTVDEQSVKIDEQSAKIDSLLKKSDEQLGKIDALTSLNKNMIKEVRHVMGFFMPLMTAFSKTWYGANVFNTQLDILATTPSKLDHATKLKFLFCVGFYKQTTDTRGELLVYFCNRNFSNCSSRIKYLYEKHKEEYTMFRPLAICLFSQEVNLEHSMINDILVAHQYDQKHKAYVVKFKSDSKNKGHKVFQKIHNQALQMRYHIYQSKFESYRRDNLIDPKILNRIMKDDTEFYMKTTPYCQEHLNYCTTDIRNENNKLTGHQYGILPENKRLIIRRDFGSQSMTNIVYNIMKLKQDIQSMKNIEYASGMIKDDIVSDKDVYYLRRVAEIEGYDIPGIPHSSELMVM